MALRKSMPRLSSIAGEMLRRSRLTKLVYSSMKRHIRQPTTHSFQFRGNQNIKTSLKPGLFRPEC